MSKESRTEIVIKNSSVAMVCHIIGVLSSFGCRTVFTLMLGKEYLGVSGLFTNILTILSFAELGMGSAVVYRLYEPLARHDEEKILQYMELYKKLYRVIVLVILAAGMLLIPFLGYLVEAPDVKESVTLLYCLYLANTLVSYIFIYKKSLLTADQKDYLVTAISQIITIAMNGLQVIILLATKNFVLYLLLQIGAGLLVNIVCSLYANKRYSFLNKKASGKLTKDEVKDLKKDVSGLLLTKIAATTFTGTDNIFISAFIGIGSVGILSNYTLILSTINSMMNKVFNSFTASIGNLAVDNVKKTEQVLERLYFINAAMYCYICAGMIVLVREFVTQIWLSPEFQLSSVIVTLAIIELLLRSLHYPLHTTQLALGLFSQYRIMYLIAAVLNLLLDFILVKPLGISGLFIATILCRGIIFVTDIYVVYHFGFQKPMTSYYLMVLKWLLLTTIVCLLSFFVIYFVTVSGLVGFAIKVVCVSIIYVFLFWLLNRKSSDYVYFKCLACKMLLKVGKKR